MEPTTMDPADDAPRIDARAMPTAGGEALDLTVSSTSRGEHTDFIATGGGEMLTDLTAGAADAVFD